MKTTKNTRNLFTKAALLVSLTIAQASMASVSLPIGAGPTFLPGSTAAVEADLAGAVVHDSLLPFQIVNAAGALLFKGQLQNRVVKSSVPGGLHFYYRIRDTRPGLNGIIKAVVTDSFIPTPNIKVDWRPDGLGLVNPIRAQRSSGDGKQVMFTFDTTSNVLVGGRESRFFFVKTAASGFNAFGVVRIILTSGESVVVRTVQPVR